MTELSQPTWTPREYGAHFRVTPETARRWAKEGVTDDAFRSPTGRWLFHPPDTAIAGRRQGSETGKEEPANAR
jgi:hypothetical protein